MQGRYFFKEFVLCVGLISSGVVLAGTVGEATTIHEHWNGGINFQIVQPFFQNNPAFHFLSASREVISEANFNVVDIQSQKDVSHKMDLAPEFYLGYVMDSGLGFRTRFWFFDQSTKQSVTTPPTSVADLTLSFPVSSAAPIGLDIDTRDNNLRDSMTVKTKLKTQIWDGIITKSYDVLNSTLVVGGGARYAYMSQAYDAFETQEPGETLDIRVNPPVPQFITEHKKTLVSGHNFWGWGPVIMLEDRVTLGRGFSLVGLARGSAVFGPAKQEASKTLLVRGTQNGNEILNENAFVQRKNTHQSVLEIIEAELGIEYNKLWGKGRLSAQLSAVAQEWIGGGSASKSATTGAGFGLPGSGMTGAPQVAGATSESNFGFWGGAFKIGYYL